MARIIFKVFFSIYFGKKYLKILKNENTYIAVLTSFHKKFLKIDTQNRKMFL